MQNLKKDFKTITNLAAVTIKVITVIIVIIVFISNAVVLLLLSGCKNDLQTSQIILATTTSTQDSGLLDELIPAFEKATGYKVKVIAVGTGEAIELASRGQADVILVHSRVSEDKMIKEGYGINRKDVMHNEFIIVGPKNDPAKILGMGSAMIAFKAIAESKCIFVSRADDSGTHKKELLIWENLGIKPIKEYYIETGQGMGETLKIADEKQGYTLTDNATWLTQKANFTLVKLLEGDEQLYNPYSVIAANPKKHPKLKLNYKGAIAFINWITDKQAQNIIRNFGVEKYGKPLFYPDAIK